MPIFPSVIGGIFDVDYRAGAGTSSSWCGWSTVREAIVGYASAPGVADLSCRATPARFSQKRDRSKTRLGAARRVEAAR
jgi:hypothetical protein